MISLVVNGQKHRVDVEPDQSGRAHHRQDPRGRAVIETVASKADWTPGFRSNGRHGRGIGFARYKGGNCVSGVPTRPAVRK